MLQALQGGFFLGAWVRCSNVCILAYMADLLCSIVVLSLYFDSLYSIRYIKIRRQPCSVAVALKEIGDPRSLP